MDLKEEGNEEAAEKALENYNEYANKIEEEGNPEKREDARRSAAAINNALKDHEGEEFEKIKSKEGNLVTAVEVSSKILELCEQLALLDPIAYSETCKVGEDEPEWKRKMHADLSKEQEKIAKDFVGIMKQCFKTSGKDCACEDIPFYDFSVACSKAAPLAMACDLEGDENACDDLDNLEMPELPEWLEPIWMELEGGMNEAQYDMHMPFECVEEGIDNPKDCKIFMITYHAPLECRAALLESGCEHEFECRKICDEIMFEQHAPPECIDKGITDPRECGDFMDSFRRDDHFGPKNGLGMGPNCDGIEDPMERLECYDNKGNEMNEYYGPMDGEGPGGEITWQCKENRIHWGPDCETFMKEEWPEQEKRKMEEGDMRRKEEGDWRVKEKECIEKCGDRPWDFSGGNCVCGEKGDYYGGPEKGFYSESECKDGCQDECPGASRTDCVNDKCECYYEDKEPPREEYRDEYRDENREEYREEPREEYKEEYREEPREEYREEPKEQYNEPPQEQFNEPPQEQFNEPPQEEPTPVTGSFITGNAFLDYYFNRR